MDRLDELFAAQLRLIHKIGPVYSANGFDDWTRAPVLDNRVHQAHVKYIAWCFIEELVEAEDAKSPEEAREEVVDALHFLLELMIFCDVSPNTLFSRVMTSIGVAPAPTLDRLDYMFFMAGTHPSYGKLNHVTLELGRAMYELKQKPWRVTDKPANVEELRRSLGVLFHAFISYAQSKGLTAKSLYFSYFEKNGINHARVEEKY